MTGPVTSVPVTAAAEVNATPGTQARTCSRTTSRRSSQEGDGEYGICRVICYSPRHDLGFGELPLAALEKVVETWTEQYAELGADPRIGHVQIFENRGQQMGASNPHPHGQIWATEHVPTIVAREQEHLGGAPVLADYVKSERDRIVVENEHFLAVVPYWANWPFETLVIARRQAASLTELKDHEREALSPVLREARHALRRSVRDAVPLLDGYPPGPDVRRLAGERVPPSFPLLSSTLAIGEHPQVHGRIRASRRSAARPHSGRSRRAPSSGEAVIVARAPGRVNLIGEHTDYNEGFVMPIAIDRGTTVTAIRRADRTVTVESRELRESDRFSLDGIEATGSWRDYVRGIVGALSLEHGVDLRIESDLPRGAGLSSSAALEVAVASALSDAPAAELALLAQRVENEFVGVQCGIMDQLTVAIAKANHALLLDCRDLTTRYVPIPDGVAIVVCDSRLERRLASSGYNERRAACQEAARMIGVNSLRDASLRQIEDLPYPLRRRARHVVTENQRTIAAAEALLVNDVAALGELMNDSHRSMRDDFEIVPVSTRRSSLLRFGMSQGVSVQG